MIQIYVEDTGQMRSRNKILKILKLLSKPIQNIFIRRNYTYKIIKHMLHMIGIITMNLWWGFGKRRICVALKGLRTSKIDLKF